LSLKLKNTAVYTILGFLPLSFSLIFTPIYTQYLSKEDYGLLNLFTIISGLLIPFFSLGIDQAFGYLYWDYHKDKKKFSALISTTFLLVFATGFIIICLGVLCGPWLMTTFVKNGERFTLWPFLALSFVYPFFMIINRVLLSYYRNEENIKKYALLNLSSLFIITAGSIIGVIALNKEAVGAVEGRTIGFCLIVLAFIIYEIKKIGAVFNKNIAIPLLKLGGPLFFSTLVGSLAYVLDRIIVEQLDTLEMLGVYGFSVTIASVIEILLAALSNSFVPSIYKNILDENEAQYENIHFQLFIYAYSIMAFVVMLIAIITPFVTIFISHNFIGSIQFIPLLCLSFIPRCFTQIFSLKFYKQKKTTYVLLLNVIYLASIFILGIIFYNYFGVKGVALSVFLTSLNNMFFAYRLSKKIDPFLFRFNKLFLLFLLITISVFAIYLIPQAYTNQYIIYFIPLSMFMIASIIIVKKECLLIKKNIFLAFNKFIKK
jgi:O-antigen/teichoic acid export membrane protein